MSARRRLSAAVDSFLYANRRGQSVLLALSLAVSAVLGSWTEKHPASARSSDSTSPLPIAASASHRCSSRRDADGDPLPMGVLSMIGSRRLRHPANLNALCYTPDGRSLASTSSDGFLRLWDAATGKLRWRLAFAADRCKPVLAVSPDGKTLGALTDVEYLAVEIGSGKIVRQLKWPKTDPDESIRALAISPDLTRLARGVGDSLKLCDAATGRETFSNKAGEKATSQLLWDAQFTADGKTVYVSVANKPEITAYDTVSGRIMQTLNAKAGSAHHHLYLSRDGRFLAAFNLGERDTVAFWDLATGQRMSEGPTVVSPIDAAFAPDRPLFAICGQQTVIPILKVPSGQQQHGLPFHLCCVALAFSPDGSRLATGDNDGCISIWDTKKWKLVPPTPDPNTRTWDLHFSADGKQLRALAAEASCSWDFATGKLLWRLPRDAHWFSWFASSADGKLIAARSGTHSVAIVDAASGRVVRTLGGLKSWMLGAAFSPDGTKLFIAGGADALLTVYDLRTGQTVHELSNRGLSVARVAISPDGRWLASAGPTADPDICLWDVAHAKLVHRLTPLNGSVSQMVFSGDCRCLVSVGGEPNLPHSPGPVQLWHVATGREVRTFLGHRDPVNCVSITPDGRMIATGGQDKTLRLWEVASGLERRRLVGHERCVESVGFSADGRLLASASGDVLAFIWDAFSKELLAQPKLFHAFPEWLWQCLADRNAANAFDAICVLLTRADAVETLRQHWNARPKATAAQMEGWTRDLDRKEFAVREHAATELKRFMVGHETLLRETAERTASAEVRQHLQEMLGNINPERLRRTRMLEVLEHVGSPESKRFLHELANEKEDTTLAKEATESLQRLGQR